MAQYRLERADPSGCRDISLWGPAALGAGGVFGRGAAERAVQEHFAADGFEPVLR